VNVLLTNATDIFAGGEDYVLILAKYLRLRGHRVWVSGLPQHLLLKKCEDLGIPTVPVAYRGMSRVFAVSRELRRAIIRHDIEVVHSNANYDRTCAAIATAFTRVRHVAGVHSAHSIQHNLTHWTRNRFGIDHFITDADAGKNVLMGEDRIPADRITTVAIGIEGDSPEYRCRARKETRATLGISDSTIVIGNVARLVTFKGHRYLLEAIARIAAEYGNIFCPIIGDGDLMDALQDQARRQGIERIVQFLGFRDNLNALYPAFDIYCHSSLELAAEMFPVAILRALASELPVVCTDVGGIALMVRDGISGYLVRPADSAALAAALCKLIADRNLRKSMGAASAALFHRHFQATVMAEAVERVYIALAQ
jgi:glycosyltransferase involved in cell wall biosynthesis